MLVCFLNYNNNNNNIILILMVRRQYGWILHKCGGVFSHIYFTKYSTRVQHPAILPSDPLICYPDLKTATTLVLIAACIFNNTYQWYALPPIPEAWWGKGGELTFSNGTSPHTWGTILCTILLGISYKYPITPCCGQCVRGRYEYLWNS